MLNRLRDYFASLADPDEEIAWDLEPHLSDTVRALLAKARDEGDSVSTPRIVRHILTLPDRRMASAFRGLVPNRWTTLLSKREDQTAWQCECDRLWTPGFADLVLDTHLLWSQSLSIYPKLWTYIGMHDSTGEHLWFVAPPILEFE